MVNVTSSADDQRVDVITLPCGEPAKDFFQVALRFGEFDHDHPRVCAKKNSLPVNLSAKISYRNDHRFCLGARDILHPFDFDNATVSVRRWGLTVPERSRLE